MQSNARPKNGGPATGRYEFWASNSSGLQAHVGPHTGPASEQPNRGADGQAGFHLS